MMVLKYYQQREKGLLRQALSGLLPQEVLWRRKSPYPKTHNPAYFEVVRKQSMAILEDKNSPLYELLDCRYLKTVIGSDDAEHNRPWFGQLMSRPQLCAYLVQLSAWLRHYQVKLKW